MKHYILVNHHHIYLPGVRDLIKNFRKNEKFEISHWGGKGPFIDPRKSEYESISLLGNFQKMDKGHIPLRVPDYQLYDLWSQLKIPRIWISSMIDLHLGIHDMLFGKNSRTTHDAKQVAIDSFDGLAWSYEHFNPDKSVIDEVWTERLRLANETGDFLVKNFKNRLDFPWAVDFPTTKRNSATKYDFCIPGASYPTRVAVEKSLSKSFTIAPYLSRDKNLKKIISTCVRLFPPIRPFEIPVKTKIREINMNRLINSSKFTYVDGSHLDYFVRKYLEVTVSGSMLVCAPTNALNMYGFITNKHFIDVNSFLQNPNIETKMSGNNLKIHEITLLLEKKHSFNARIKQLTDFIENLSNHGTSRGVFKNGIFILSS